MEENKAEYLDVISGELVSRGLKGQGTWSPWYGYSMEEHFRQKEAAHSLSSACVTKRKETSGWNRQARGDGMSHQAGPCRALGPLEDRRLLAQVNEEPWGQDVLCSQMITGTLCSEFLDSTGVRVGAKRHAGGTAATQEEVMMVGAWQ